MAQYRIYDPEELMECPYDRVMVSAKRFPYHLINCRKNHPGKKYASCPFNARHEMPIPEMRYHLTVCPDRAMIEPELSYAQRKASGQELQMKGCTDTPVYNNIQIDTGEDWDAEVEPRVRVGPIRDQSYHSRVVFMDRSRSESNSVSPNVEVEEHQRLPKTASIAAIQPKPVDQPVSSVFAYSIGRGRGRGNGQGQPTQAEPVGATAAFTPAYGRGAALGIGRGLAPGMGRRNIAPPPGFCVPNINERNNV